MMALTATCSEKIKGDILKSLQLSENDTDIIFKCPDRPNIFIDVRKRDNSDFSESLFWLILERMVFSQRRLSYTVEV